MLPAGLYQGRTICRNRKWKAAAFAGGTVMLFTWAGLVVQGADLPPLPETPKKPVIDIDHGTSGSDDYRWLEDDQNPQVASWSEAQNQCTRARLDGNPIRGNIAEFFESLYSRTSAEYYSIKYTEGTFLAIKWQPPAEQPFLVELRSMDDLSSERVILDLNQLDPSGGTAIDWYVPSPDGRLIAISLSQQGSEIGTVYIYETAAGTRMPDSIPRVNGPTAGGSVAWLGDGTGLYYTRYPRPGERPDGDLHFFQQVYFHRLGTPTAEDVYSIGREFPRIAEIYLKASEDGRYFLATVANGDGGEYNHYILGPDGKWRGITAFSDKITQAEFGLDGRLYMLSTKDAPLGKIIRLRLDDPDLAKAETIVPESEVVIQSFEPTENYLYVTDLAGGPSRLRQFKLNGNLVGEIQILPVSSVWGVQRIDRDQVIFNNESYTEPSTWYEYDPATGETNKTALAVKAPVDFSDIDITREYAVSKDGTRIPLNILKRKGVSQNGQAPTVLYGYGGYGISLTPGFDAGLRFWFDQGGTYVIANIRGGGEFGEKWHLDGNLTKKQNVFDDFIAGAEYLISQGYTNSQTLAIKGGSNGGLLVGAVMTQRPELFRAVLAMVGVLDMVNYVQDPNGVFNTTEYGDVKNPDEFRALLAYSPYHNIRDGVKYPDVMFMTGANDGRVPPYHSRKMTARLQAASPTSEVLLRVSDITGHGGGTPFSAMVAQLADQYTFLCEKLGVKYMPYETDVEKPANK